MLKKLIGLGITVLTWAAVMGVTSGAVMAMSLTEAYPEVQVETVALDRNGGIEISNINEGRNMVKMMYTGEDEVGNENYMVSEYKIYWEDDEGEKIVAQGTDGEAKFTRSHMQVGFVSETVLTANEGKILSYEVYLKAQKDGYADKIIKGAYSYGYCVNSVGYVTDGSVFCSRDEWAGGKSFYQAYNSDWQKLEPMATTIVQEVVKEVEKIKEVEVPVEVIKEVEVPVEVIKEVEVPVETIVEKIVEVVKEVEKEVEVPVEVIKEVEVPVEVVKEVEVPVEVLKEVIKEVPVETVVEKVIEKTVDAAEQVNAYAAELSVDQGADYGTVGMIAGGAASENALGDVSGTEVAWIPTGDDSAAGNVDVNEGTTTDDGGDFTVMTNDTETTEVVDVPELGGEERIGTHWLGVPGMIIGTVGVGVLIWWIFATVSRKKKEKK